MKRAFDLITNNINKYKILEVGLEPFENIIYINETLIYFIQKLNLN